MCLSDYIQFIALGIIFSLAVIQLSLSGNSRNKNPRPHIYETLH